VTDKRATKTESSAKKGFFETCPDPFRSLQHGIHWIPVSADARLDIMALTLIHTAKSRHHRIFTLFYNIIRLYYSL
jgi:hypothetical protein